MSEIKIGCEVFVVKHNSLLFGKRKNCFGAGDWGLPGGHLEYGEDLIEAAKRELSEEVGIQNASLEFRVLVDDPRQDNHYIHVAFILSDFAGDIKLMEPERCEEWRFFPINALPENIFVGHKNIIEAFLHEQVYRPSQ